MPAFNEVLLIGTLTKDIELKYTKGAKPVAVTDISIAINERVKKGDEWVTDTLFTEVTLWGKNAENAEKYIGKGSNVFLKCRLKKDQWDSPEGKKMEKLKIVCETMQFLDKPGGQKEQNTPQRQEPAKQQSRQSQEDDSAPF